MATVTGNAKDFRPLPLGATAELVFRPDRPATTGSSVLATKEIRTPADGAGAFSVDLAASESTNPSTIYWLTIEWSDSGGNYQPPDRYPEPVVVPAGGGLLSTMFADVQGGKIITKGDKGDPGNVVQQAAIDALNAKDRTHDAQIGSLQVGVAANAAGIAAHGRLIDQNAEVARIYTDARTQGVIDLMDTSNVNIDTDGAPFIHFGSMTVAVLQDTDGNPYYKARS
ncbi:hypothetical protein ASF72_10600 [Arthrobacter sp. Leaf141]|uniref:hypothetical protein n=1 Tax=Arthrobacter sp. Leaf141 TaxID=1736273 RepID=UPI0006FBE550|nr:hypothetical protein [Arthrobacter sp. Leaf141]KQR02475.1 hypothetical protein ASF72_10600 [Arthrobacter sp. Leaf141]